MTIMERVRRYICEVLADDVEPQSLTPDLPLIDEGVLDSLTTFRLMAFLGEEYGIAIGDEELTYDNFQSLAAIARLVEDKLAVRTPAERPGATA
jgi:acyl carrier protein